MLRFILVSSLMAFALASQVCAQQMEDVVHLKNGSIIRGMIIEQVPDESLKVRIQTQDGSLLFYTMDEIARMAKEPRMGTDERVPGKKDAPATGVEIGTFFGITRSESSTLMNMPGGALFGGLGPLPAFYVSWSPSERVAIGPEVNFGRFSDDENSFTSLWLGCRATFFLRSSSILRQPKGESREGHALSAPSGSVMSGIYVHRTGCSIYSKEFYMEC